MFISNEYEPLGCFADKVGNRALPKMIENFRNTIDWKHMEKTVAKCAEKSHELGYDYFGIQWYGECWTGQYADTSYNKHGPSTGCWSGVGTELSNFVYRITSAED